MFEKPTIPTSEKNPSFDPLNLKFWKNHLQLIVIIPYIIGGIWQIAELSRLSLAYVRFFSVSQSISDGLLVLIILFLIFSVSLVFKRTDITEKIVRKWLMTKDETDVKVLVYLLTIFVAAVLLSPLMLALNWTANASVLLYLLVGFVLWSSIYLSKDRYSNSQPFTRFQKVKRQLFIWMRFGLLLFFISYVAGFLPFALNVLHRSFTFPENNLNLGVQRALIQRRNNAKRVEILYFNDKYIFWQATDRQGTERIIISGFEEVVANSMETVKR